MILGSSGRGFPWLAFLPAWLCLATAPQLAQSRFRQIRQPVSSMDTLFCRQYKYDASIVLRYWLWSRERMGLSDGMGGIVILASREKHFIRVCVNLTISCILQIIDIVLNKDNKLTYSYDVQKYPFCNIKLLLRTTYQV